MKIAFLEGDMSRAGGTERMTAFLANALCSAHTVYILSLHGSGESFFLLQPQVVHIWLQKKHPRQAIHRFLRKEMIDIAVNVDTGMSIFGIPSAWGTNAKVITWEHANYFNNWGSRWFPYIRSFAARFSDAIVVLTERDKQNYQTHFKHCSPITVIGNPVDPQVTAYSAESKTILSAGHFSPVKRFMLIPEIGKSVFSMHPDWKWRICGDGLERTALEKKLAEYGLEKNIVLVGTVKDMDIEYRGAAMYVLTSEMEGVPMVLLEAKSYGLPIVSFDIMTGPSEIVRDDVNGFLIESGNVAAMAEKICKLIEQPSLRKQFSESASMDMEKFDRKAIIEKWTKLFKSLI